MAPVTKWRDDDLNGGVVPFVFLDLAGKKPTTTYAKGRIRVIAVEASMSLRIRGNYTATWPKPGYAVELQDDAGADRDLPLVGLPPDSEWSSFRAGLKAARFATP